MSRDFAPHNMTAENAPSPYVLSGTDTAYFRFRAFDGIDGSGAPYLTIIPADLIIDLGAGNSKILAQYAFRITGDAGREPQTWTVRGSTDNFVASDDLIDTVAASTGWTAWEKRTFTSDIATTPYRYFKFAFTATAGSGNLSFTEIYLYQPPGNPDLDRSGWTAYADSSEASHLPAKAIDLGNDTAWRTDTPPPFGSSVYPHEFWVDMGAAHLVNYVRFRPDDLLFSGLPQEVEVYLSADGTHWGSAVAWSSWPLDNTEKTLVFGAQTKRWIKLRMRNGQANAGCTDFNAGYDATAIGLLALKTNALPNGVTGQPYAVNPLLITGGTAPYTATITAGALPAGLSMDSEGRISGTPTAGGAFSITIQVTDAASHTASTGALPFTVFLAGDPTGGATITDMKFVLWYAYAKSGYDDHDGNPFNDSNGAAYVFLGDVGNTPGSVISGAGALMQDGTPTVKRQFLASLPLDGTGEVPVTGGSADPSAAVVWLSLGGPNGFPPTFDVLNEWFVYGLFFQATYSDGTRAYSFPTTYTIETNAVGPITDPALALDGSLDTAAYLTRANWSGVGIASYLRITGFGPFTSSPVPPESPHRNWAY